jgi:hypothetical protein
MKFYVMGTQPSTEKALSLSSKVFDNLQEALHYRDTVSPAWRPIVACRSQRKFNKEKVMKAKRKTNIELVTDLMTHSQAWCAHAGIHHRGYR